MKIADGEWGAVVNKEDVFNGESAIGVDADTPENALAKLAIELLRAGVLLKSAA